MVTFPLGSMGKTTRIVRESDYSPASQLFLQGETRIVRESDYSPASQLFLQGEKNNDR